jgi:cold shock protein
MSEEVTTKTEMRTGYVKWFKGSRDGQPGSYGYGFICPDDGGSDCFVHISAVARAGLETLLPDQKVRYSMVQDSKTGRQRVDILELVV